MWPWVLLAGPVDAGMDTDRLAVDTVSVPAGTLLMGDGRSPDAPLHTVKLSAFRIDRVEVTVDAYERFAQVGYAAPALWSVQGRAWLAAHPQGAGAQARAAGRGADHPVVAVTWYEAQAYCAWVGGALPTEAQWERAALGEGGQRYPWGDDEHVDAVWYSAGKLGLVRGVQTRPAQQQEAALASPFGLLHMAGNVWEWTADWYDRDGYATHQGVDPTGPATGTWRVKRGGAYMNLPSYCTGTHREPASPDQASFTTGLRCAYASVGLDTP